MPRPPDPRARRALALVAVLLTGALVATAAAAPLAFESATTSYTRPHAGLVVGVASEATLSALQPLGARVVRFDPYLGFAVVNAADEGRFIGAAKALPGVAYVALNGFIRADGSTWDGSSWDGSTWDGSTWDGSTWDGSTWDGSTWDGSTWDGSSWDGSSWDGSTWDGSSWDGSTWDGSSWDGSSAGFTRADRGYPVQWGLGAINAPGAWDTTVGTLNRNVCVVDSGVDYDHPDLAPNMWRSDAGLVGRDIVNNDDDPMDDGGHGTHVAGIAAAATGNGIGIAGVAQAKIMAVKVLDATGVGTEADLASGISWCARNGAHVIQASVGTPYDVRAVRQAVQQAEERGVLVVASAGNSGCACIQYPAAYSTVLSVGAIRPDGTRAGFSNSGSYLDLVAPGMDIASTFPGASYVTGSGTSQAAPHVAGVAALVWGLHPAWNAQKVREALTDSARDLGPAGFDSEHGHGLVDAHAAVLWTD